MRPVIGVTCSFSSDGFDPPRPRIYLNAAYADAVFRARGLPQPLALPPDFDEPLLDELVAHCDGFLFTGGPDLHPRHYGQPLHERTEPLDPRRDAFDIALFAAAERSRKPILAICLGCQITNVARGGCLLQHVDDLPRQAPLMHYRPDHGSAFHDVLVAQDSRLARILGRTRLEVNSRHHQVVDPERLGNGLRPVAFAPDGVLEAAEETGDRFLIAVQWHPEDLTDRPEHLRLFQALVEAAAANRG